MYEMFAPSEPICTIARLMAPRNSNDPLSLSGRQVKTFASATARELAWGLPEVSRETRRWSELAGQIPDGPLHVDAIRALEGKREQLAGAALFITLLSERNSALLQALVAFQTIFDFLDNVHERHPTGANGQRLYLALIDALIPGGPVPDYFAHHSSAEDGGYLQALVKDCRRRCATLPSFAAVQGLLVREARRAQRTLPLNHLADPASRDRALCHWAHREFPEQSEWRWYELTAAASGQLAILVLLALAAKPTLGAGEVEATYAAYWPAIPALTTMLDSFVDQAEGTDDGNHRYVAHYPERPVDRLSELIVIAASGLTELPDANRHMVILGCIIAFYLATDSAWATGMEEERRQLLQAGGSLPEVLAPVLRPWRGACSQRAA
jgi:tetraprenyl-beta-curcumene synthase